MKFGAAPDWRDALAFEVPMVVAAVAPGEDTRCSVCGGSSAPRPRAELWAVKHRHPTNHQGFVRFYCSEHLPEAKPAPAEQMAPAPRRTAAARRPRGAATTPRPTPAAERPKQLCPNCFVEVPPTGVCGMCGTHVG